MAKSLIPKIRFEGFSNQWKKEPIRNFVKKVGSGSTPSGGSKVYRSSGIPFIRSQNVLDNYLDLSDVTYIAEDTHRSMKGSKVKARDLLLNITGGSIGRSCVVPLNFDEANVNQHVCIVRFKDDVIPEFAQAFLASFNGQKNIMRNQAGGGREGINFEGVKDIKLPYTCKEEQQKIADILSLVDKKMALLKEKRALLARYKKGVMQKLFKQEIRFKDDDDSDFPNWENKKFSSFLRAKNETPDVTDASPLASLTIENGIEAKSARYVRNFLVKDESNAYKLVKPDDFVLNPMNLRWGAISKNNLGQTVKVSRYYDVFAVSDEVNVDYFQNYLLSHEMMRTYNRTATGTLEEKKRVHFSEFINFEKLFPCLAEQIKIAEFIRTFDHKLRLITRARSRTFIDQLS